MTLVCLYLKLHKPYTLKTNGIDNEADRVAINLLADKCCLPANEIIYEQLVAKRGKFRISFSISGIMLELFQRYRPDVIVSFKKLSSTGFVDFLAETYYHSLSSIYSAPEFQIQVMDHAETIYRLFGINATIFRNTELIHNNKIAALVNQLGFKGILCEGISRFLRGRDCNQLYAAPGCNELTLFLRNATWPQQPLDDAGIINLFLDYETYGFTQLPFISGNDKFIFSTASELVEKNYPKDIYDVDATTWSENVVQNNTLKKIYSIEKLVGHGDKTDLTTWRMLQAADYFYYTSKESFRHYSNIVTDFELSLIKKQSRSQRRSYRELLPI